MFREVRIGRYEIVAEVGRGGLGVVYQGRAPDGRAVAVKLLQRMDPETLARFSREERLQEGLGEAEGFVPLLDTGVLDGRPFLVMPFVEGGTLRAQLRGEPLPVLRVLAIGRALARTLGEAHARGVVHRDVKPENVLLARDGRPLLVDLGLAKHYDRLTPGASASVSLSADGTLRGTAGYMAPEQMEDARRVGPPADVFALGAVLYECLAGKPAFVGETVLDVISRVTAGRVEPLRTDAPRWLVRVVERALTPDPARRFQDGFALSRALAGHPAAPRRAALPAGVALLLVAGVGVALWRSRSVKEAPLDPPKAPVAHVVSRLRPEPSRSAEEARELALRSAERLAGSDRDGALELAERALELDATLPRAWLARSEARFTLGDDDGALADVTRALELDPGLARAWGVRGTYRNKRGDLDGALADETRAIELDPGIANAWASRGEIRAKLGRLDEALLDLERATQLDPTFAGVWINRGRIHGIKGDWEGEIADLTRAIELAPGLVQAWENRGTARYRKGDRRGAIADFTRAIEIDPRSTRGWSNRGVAREDEGDFDGAIADATRAIELDPGLASAFVNRGDSRGKKGDWDGDLSDQNHAIELDPRLAPAWADRGEARARKGDLDGSLEDETRAIELDPRCADAWLNRAAVRARRGDLPGARADHEHFLELEPKGPRAEGARKWLAANR